MRLPHVVLLISSLCFPVLATQVAVGQPSRPDDFLDGLESFWRLDEQSDGSAPVIRHDCIGGNHLSDPGFFAGEHTPGTSDSPFPSIDPISAEFQASSNHFLTISDTDQSGLEFVGPVSVSFAFWVKLNSPATRSDHILGKWLGGTCGGGCDGGYEIIFNNADQIRFVVNHTGSGASNRSIDSIGTITNDGNWHHVVVTADFAANVVRIYIDGAFDVEDPVFDVDPRQSSPGAFQLGRAPDVDIPFPQLDGRLKDVAIWNRILTDTEIGELGDEDEPPIAVVGTSLDGTNQLQLDGGLSTDPDDDPLEFAWVIRDQSDMVVAALAFGDGVGSPNQQTVPLALLNLNADTYTVSMDVRDGTSTSMVQMSLGVPACGPLPGVDYPDLAFDEPDAITFQGNNNMTTAHITNIGTSDADSVTVHLLVNDQFQLERANVSVAVGETTEVKFATPNLISDDLVTMLIDPDNKLTELDETNNSAERRAP